MKTLGLFLITALAEIIGCYLPWLWLRRDGSAWLLLPAAASLALFAWLLTLHPDASGRIYAAYGACMWARRCSGFGWSTASVPVGGTCWACRCAWPAWP